MAKKIKKIEIKRDLCIGAASCLGVAPEAYDLDEENIAILKDSWQNLSDDILLGSAESCPTKAIYLFDQEGNQVYP